jgi:hypothetical protein
MVLTQIEAKTQLEVVSKRGDSETIEVLNSLKKGRGLILTMTR